MPFSHQPSHFPSQQWTDRLGYRSHEFAALGFPSESNSVEQFPPVQKPPTINRGFKKNLSR